MKIYEDIWPVSFQARNVMSYMQARIDWDAEKRSPVSVSSLGILLSLLCKHIELKSYDAKSIPG